MERCSSIPYLKQLIWASLDTLLHDFFFDLDQPSNSLAATSQRKFPFLCNPCQALSSALYHIYLYGSLART